MISKEPKMINPDFFIIQLALGMSTWAVSLQLNCGTAEENKPFLGLHPLVPSPLNLSSSTYKQTLSMLQDCQPN